MRKKNIVSKTVGTVVGTVQEYGYSLLLGVVFLGVIVTKSGEVKAAKKVVTKCMELNPGINNPTAGEATNPASYFITGIANDCPIPAQTLCQICIDTDGFELDGTGVIDFNNTSNSNNVALKSFIELKKDDLSIHGNPIVVPGTSKSVTLYFRADNSK